MGSSPRATIAWGVDFGDPDNTSEGFDFEDAIGMSAYSFDDEMPALFGFTEEPPVRPDGLENDAYREWWQANRAPYNDRREAAVPLAFAKYGYEFGGTALVLKRSMSRVEWGAEAINPATLAPPSDAELEAFRIVLDRLGHNGEVVLLLMALYG